MNCAGASLFCRTEATWSTVFSAFRCPASLCPAHRRRTANGVHGWLERFIFGPENQLAEAAIHALLSDNSDPYNPLMFYGPSGTGKSHLARGVADVSRSELHRSVLYVNAADFSRELTDALETNALGNSGPFPRSCIVGGRGHRASLRPLRTSAETAQHT